MSRGRRTAAWLGRRRADARGAGDRRAIHHAARVEPEGWTACRRRRSSRCRRFRGTARSRAVHGHAGNVDRGRLPAAVLHQRRRTASPASFTTDSLLPEHTTIFFRARLTDRFGVVAAEARQQHPVRGWVKLIDPPQQSLVVLPTREAAIRLVESSDDVDRRALAVRTHA